MTQPVENGVKQTTTKKPAAAAGKAKAKQEKKGNTLLLIIIILILTSIVAIGAIFMFNFGGLKSETSVWLSNIPVVGKLIKPVVENKTPEQLAMEEVQMEKSKNAIALQEINDKKKELEDRERNITSKERELSDKELQINDTLLKLSGQLTSIQEQVAYLEKLDNAKAMQIIISMDKKESAVQILRNMKTEKASAILGLMDPLQAAQILEDLSTPEQSAENPQPAANP